MTNNNTTQRSIRIPDDLWHRVQTQAAQDHINVSDLIRGLLRGWLDDDKLEGEK